MTTKKVLLALAATSLLAFGSFAPVFAQDSMDDGASTEAPADPGGADEGDAASDPGMDEGAGDASGDAGGEPQPE
jgi:hypothetical protein